MWASLIACFVFALPFIVRTALLARVPSIDEPFDIEAFKNWDISPEEDAYSDYRLAAKIYRTLSLESFDLRRIQTVSNAVFEEGWVAADEQLGDWLELHRDAIAIWRRGTERILCKAPTATQELSYNIPYNMEFIKEQRSFIQQASLNAIRCIHKGHLDEARQLLRAIDRCGAHVSCLSGTIGVLSGWAIHATSIKDTARWAENPGLTSKQLRDALWEVKNDKAMYELKSNRLKVEYLWTRSVLQSRSWFGFIDLSNYIDMSSDHMGAVVRMGGWCLGEPELTLRIRRHLLANQLPEVDKPLSSRRKIAPGFALMFEPNPALRTEPRVLPPSEIDRIIRWSFLARETLSGESLIDTVMLQSDARTVALETLLAAQAYFRDHGQFPTELSLLIPEYIYPTPLDPCDVNGGPIHYRRDEPTKAVVWSVGSDGLDAGGQIDYVNSPSPDIGFVIKGIKAE